MPMLGSVFRQIMPKMWEVREGSQGETKKTDNHRNSFFYLSLLYARCTQGENSSILTCSRTKNNPFR